MNTKKILLGGLAGGVTFFLLGWVFYGMLLRDFFASHAGSATGVDRSETEMMPSHIFIGNLAFGYMYALVFGKWGNINTAGGGMIAGAIIGFLVTTGFDFIMYATTNITTMTGVAADIAVTTVMSAIAGAVVASVLGSGKKAA